MVRRRKGLLSLAVFTLSAVTFCITLWYYTQLVQKLYCDSLIGGLQKTLVKQSRHNNIYNYILKSQRELLLETTGRLEHLHGYWKPVYKAYLRAADMSLAIGDPGHAWRLANAALKLHPLQPQNYLIMGRVYAALYDTEKETACRSIAENLFRNKIAGLDLTTCSKALTKIRWNR